MALPPPAGLTDLSANTLAQAPSMTLTAGVDYTRELDGLGVLGVTVDYNYQSEIVFSDLNQTDATLPNTVDPLTRQGSYGIWNARVGLANIADAGISIDVWARNLADQYYLVSATNTGPFGTATAQFGAPRTIGVTIRKDF